MRLCSLLVGSLGFLFQTSCGSNQKQNGLDTIAHRKVGPCIYLPQILEMTLVLQVHMPWPLSYIFENPVWPRHRLTRGMNTYAAICSLGCDNWPSHTTWALAHLLWPAISATLSDLLIPSSILSSCVSLDLASLVAKL